MTPETVVALLRELERTAPVGGKQVFADAAVCVEDLQRRSGSVPDPRALAGFHYVERLPPEEAIELRRVLEGPE